MAGLYGRMKLDEQPEPERAVWLRYWREPDGWRFVIEDPRTHARVAFARADDLAAFLQDEGVHDGSAMREPSSINLTGRRQSDKPRG
jgi:hypothetical protein